MNNSSKIREIQMTKARMAKYAFIVSDEDDQKPDDIVFKSERQRRIIAAVARGDFNEFLALKKTGVTTRGLIQVAANTPRRRRQIRGQNRIIRYLLRDPANHTKENWAIALEKTAFAYGGLPPLSWAILCGYLDVVNALLENGADPNALVPKSAEHQWFRGDSALVLALHRNNVGVVKALLKHGVNVNARDMSDRTALFFVDYGGEYICDLLIKHGANVNYTNNRGQTALMRAAIYMNAGCVKKLLEHGAKVDVKDADGQTVIDILREYDVDEDNIYDDAYDKIFSVLVMHSKKQHILTTYMAMLPLEMPVYQFWWIMQFETNTSLLNEKEMIELLQGMRYRYNAVMAKRKATTTTSARCI